MKRILVALLLLGGCATTKPAPVPVPIPNIQPQPMDMHRVDWKVYRADQLRAILDNADPDTIFYVLDQKNFRNLTLNLTDMERYIGDQSDINDTLIGILERKR